ncbi:MAG: Holliday junction ATP-dependent DNA helicase RuvA [Chlamydiae bacterium]|nr:Holliday junction ATP-dependent DNA helicase RuvA [Chlamydiota bacterium]
MLEYIKGTLTKALPQKIAVEINGLGYALFISAATFEKLPSIGTEVKLYLSPIIREDSHKLYAFLTEQERDLFEMLNDVSGIGPRISIAVLGHLTIDDLFMAVENSNHKALSKIPGIGKKMAERLVLELRDKFPKLGIESLSLSSERPPGVTSDAIQALINLGYHPLAAQKAVKSALQPLDAEPPLPELISQSLQLVK